MNAPVDVSQIRIETDRLILRPWKESDLQDFYEYAKIPGVGEMAGWEHHASIAISEKILHAFITERKTFALELKQNKKVIGSLGLEPRDWNGGFDSQLRGREIGYVLSKDYWGRGLMVEAVKAVADYCFSELDYDYLTCGHFLKNHQSQRVIEKCGFRYIQETVHKTRMGTQEQTKMYILEKNDYIFLKMNAPFDVTGLSIETERLLLRPIVAQDYRFFRAMSIIPEVADVSGWDCRESENETQQRFQRHMERKDTFVLFLKQTGESIGTLSLQGREWHTYPIDQKLKGREFAFDLHPDYWGMGLMPEAVKTVADYCFQRLDFDFLTAGYFHGNHRSCRVIEKSGFSYLFDFELELSKDRTVTVSTFIRYKEI